MDSFEGFFAAILGIMFIIAVLSYALAYLIPIIIGVIVITLIIKLISNINKKEEERLEKKEEERRFYEAQARNEQKKQEEQQEFQREYHKKMIVLGEESISLFEGTPKYLESAEKYLDQAEVNFSYGAFAPFWDDIEKATKKLGSFYENIQSIKSNLSIYTVLIGKYEDTPPQFPLTRESVTKLDIGKETAKRLNGIVWEAQRNFQFATIYEQRKTNQILVGGFTNLATALDQMTSKITKSIDDLTGSVDVMTSTLDESLRAIHSQVGNIVDIEERTSQQINQQHDELMEKISEGVAREEKVLKMLDNIQRGRRPPS
jgi:low affinity Fe/Cu permease